MESSNSLQSLILATQTGTVLVEGVNRNLARNVVLESVQAVLQSSDESPFVIGDSEIVSIAEVRSTLARLKFSPNGRRFVVILQVDRMQLPAANALLKTLEEPPRNTLFILTALPYAALPTIRSRALVTKISDSADVLETSDAHRASLITLFRSLTDKDGAELRQVLQMFLLSAASELRAVPSVTRARVLTDALLLFKKNSLSKIEVQNIFLQWNHA